MAGSSANAYLTEFRSVPLPPLRANLKQKRRGCDLRRVRFLVFSSPALAKRGSRKHQNLS